MATANTMINFVLNATHVRNAIRSVVLSKKYVKRLLKITLLNILHQRINIPPSEFQTKLYEGVSYMVHKRKSENKFIRIYHAIGVGIMDAMEKDYLKDVSIYILRKNTKETLETYNLKIKYNKDESVGQDRDKKTNDQVKETTREYIRALTQLPGTKWKEDEVDFFIELTYNPETPMDYEPPNFEETPNPLAKETNNNPNYVQLGRVNTGFHQVSVWGKGHNFNELTDEVRSQNTIDPEEHLPPAKPDNLLAIEKTNKNEKSEDNVTERRKSQTAGSQKDLGMVQWNTRNMISRKEPVKCCCTWNLPEFYETIKCSICFTIVHLACHGFFIRKENNKAKFVCFRCTNQNPPKEHLLIMKLRIIVYGIKKTYQIPKELQMATDRELAFIKTHLGQFGIITDSESSANINVDALKEAMQVLFRSSTDESI